jgi:hypothetical protein
MDNNQLLSYLKEKYETLEQNYFKSENSRRKKYEEFDEILKKKEEEKKDLENITEIYEDHNIKKLDYFKLKNLESKIFKSLELIKERKQKSNNIIIKYYIYSSHRSKIEVICKSL